MNMNEKVARALCSAQGFDPDRLEPGNCSEEWEGVDGVLPNGDVAHYLWRDWSGRAEAAIEAMVSSAEPGEMTLGAALHELARAHTRDDDLVGFTVSSIADLFWVGQGNYVEAWKTVRQHLNLQVDPAPSKGDEK